MTGNVWEWCTDWCYDRFIKLTEKDPAGTFDPSITSNGEVNRFKFIKGGGWNLKNVTCLNVGRGINMEPEIDADVVAPKAIGFRIVRKAD